MNKGLPDGLRSWLSSGFPKVSLDAAGLVALADLSTVAHRTVLTGTSALADILVLCPGLHKQQDAPDLNKGEYPACGAMTSSYIFRCENQATVLYLQKVGRTGHLTCLSVSNNSEKQTGWMRVLDKVFDFTDASPIAVLAYSAAAALTVTVLVLLTLLKDWWAVAVLAILILARSINVVVVRRRAKISWKGEPEPGEKSDLIILMSQDRWIRMRGDVDDVKAITSGEWLRDLSFIESSLVAFATLIVYLDAALAGNATKEGKLLLLMLLFCSAGLLGIANQYTKILRMYGRSVKVEGARQPYQRRLHLTEKLIREIGTYHWALRLGMAETKDIDKLKKDGVISDHLGAVSENQNSSSDEQVIL